MGHKSRWRKNVIVKDNVETNHNFILIDSKMLVNVQHNIGKVFEFDIIFYYISIKQTPCIFQLVSLFSQISQKKLQDPGS